MNGKPATWSARKSSAVSVMVSKPPTSAPSHNEGFRKLSMIRSDLRQNLIPTLYMRNRVISISARLQSDYNRLTKRRPINLRGSCCYGAANLVQSGIIGAAAMGFFWRRRISLRLVRIGARTEDSLIERCGFSHLEDELVRHSSHLLHAVGLPIGKPPVEHFHK